MDRIKDNGSGISVHGYMFNNLRFANDIYLTDKHRKLQENVNTQRWEGCTETY